MPSWSELRQQYAGESGGESGGDWLQNQLEQYLRDIAEQRRCSDAIFYASAFLQKDGGNTSIITREDVNGFMNALSEAPSDRGLVLILHTPGGDANAVESIVEYLHSKFDHIEVVVPYLAMSGGAMICLAGDLLVLGRQSQLGPIDPQIRSGNRSHSARAIHEGFQKAREDIEQDTQLAHLWAPILQNMGPSLFLEADKALKYSKELVVNWLGLRMFKDEAGKAKTVGEYFNAESVEGHGQIHVHGQRIGPKKIKELGLNLEVLEDDQILQDQVLTAYHLMTLIFEETEAVKFITSDKGKWWIK